MEANATGACVIHQLAAANSMSQLRKTDLRKIMLKRINTFD